MSRNRNWTKIGELSDDSFMFKEVTWKISKTHILPNNVDYFIESPSFSFAGATWNLLLAPYGRTSFESIGWIDLGIQRLDSNIQQHFVFCKFYFKTNKGKEFQPYQESYVFGTNSLISSMLYIEKCDFVNKDKTVIKNGVITIVCQLRTPKINGIEGFSQTELVEPVAKLIEKISKQESISSSSEHKGLTEQVSKQESLPSTSKQKESSLENSGQELDSPTSTCKSLGSAVPSHTLTLSGIKILSDLKELFLKQEDCDVTLKVKEREFPAHKTILIARSPVFASTFRNDMKEKATGVIDIEDCDPSSFSDFLCFLYCGNAENLSTENVFSLFTTADKYDVQDLRSACMEFIKNNLSVDTFCDTITLALQHSEKELIELAASFFAKNLQEIIVTVEWQSFLLANPIQSNELMIKALVSKKK